MVVVVVTDVVVAVVTVVVRSVDVLSFVVALLIETPIGIATDAAAAMITAAPRSTFASNEGQDDLSQNRG